jgi:glycosyltransferase involved in cell wall biosynthesis
VQRVAKFVKYLPEHGWHPSVLTVANPSVPLVDESLLSDIPEHTIIRGARTWEPSYALKARLASSGDPVHARSGRARRLVKQIIRRAFQLLMQPDAQLLWVPEAIREGKRLLRELPHQAILATAPPFSTFLVGAALSRRTGLPLVLDYRDEWDLQSAYFENQRLDPLSRWIQRRMQNRVVRAATALVATTQSSAQALEQVRTCAGSHARVSWIYNGYDPADFPSQPPVLEPSPDPYRLAYVGTLWTLTSAAPLVEAVRWLSRRQPALAEDLELVFAGRRVGLQEKIVAGLEGLPCRVVEHPYLDHSEVIHLLHAADGLCALLSDLPGVSRVVPAKIFEYMAAKRPILAIAPPGELWTLLKSYPAAFLFPPADIEGIAGCLAQLIKGRRLGRSADVHDWDGSPFDRRGQAGRLAQILNSLG